MEILQNNKKTILDKLNKTDEEKEEIIKDILAEFPNDEMLFELHLYRLVNSLIKKQNLLVT